MTLAEAKTLLARLQERLIRQQADEYVTCRRGAHLLIQVRLAVLEGGLQDIF